MSQVKFCASRSHLLANALFSSAFGKEVNKSEKTEITKKQVRCNRREVKGLSVLSNASFISKNTTELFEEPLKSTTSLHEEVAL